MFFDKRFFLKILFVFSLLGFLFFYEPVFIKSLSATEFTPQITIPGSTFERGTTTEIGEGLTTLGEYVSSIYSYLLAIVGVLATIVLMVSGVIWLTASGNSEKISQAKGLMTGSLTGLVLALTSYTILITISPYLVKFRDTRISRIEPIKNEKVAVVDVCNWQEGACHVTTNEEIDLTKCGAIPSTINSSEAVCCCHQDYRMISEYAYDPRYIAPGAALVESLDPDRDPNKDCIVGYAEWKDSKNGDYCWGEKERGWCYNGICWEGEGKIGEPCGREENARCASFYTTRLGVRRCYNIKNSDGSITKWNRNIRSGRQCSGGALCCYPK